MDIKELNSVSPLRVFEESINGGLGKGNLGVIVSRHGVGKTACLVHLATDKLFKGESVIHVSFSGNVEHVINWYKEVFKEIAELSSLDDATLVYNSILANRVVMNFSQDQVPVKKVLQSLESLINQGSFKADAVLFDGYKLTTADEDDILEIKEFAKKMNLEVWFSVSPQRPDVVYDEYGVPNTILKYYDLIDVLVALRYDEKIDKVVMTVVRSHHENVPKPMKVNLDPRTMLISK
ncbi:MAG TPA: hypothetical protein IAB12_04905 [Candidatus Ornithospirochaeta avicola]|uniref:KaiC-like domain-containing protein n=1 Tax=Candidatus Ornithospirochaeta avicola TaxID=2840896 RepID=A0A9D1PU15_9SPIO|nr:hypothetical protein [Candidatus Ornithospirochaeta avicola]